jgi:hypothetical protein
MLSNVRPLLAFILTYALSRLGFQFFNFNPIKALPFWAGFAEDFLFWVAVFSLIYWAIGKLAPNRTSKP